MQQPLPNNNYNPQPSFNQNYMQQPILNLEDISDPTTAMSTELVRIAKAFKFSTPTNNNQRTSSNPCNRQIAQPGMNMGQDRQIHIVKGNGGNQFRQYVGQNVGNQNGYNALQNVRNQVVQNVVQNSDPGLWVCKWNNGNQIKVFTTYRGIGFILLGNCTVKPRRRVAAYLRLRNLDEIEEVNANCILMANLQHALTSGTQTDKAPVYDSARSAETSNLLQTKLLNLLRVVVSQDIMSIVQNPTVVETSDLQTELEYYNDTQQMIERLQAQLGDLKGKCKDTPCVSDTLDPLSHKLENENVELEFQLFDKTSEQKDTTKGTSVNTQFRKQSILGKPPSSSGSKLYAVTPFPKSKGLPMIDESHALLKPVSSNSIPTPQESKVMKMRK
ncbi:hypothetical protein Tco_0940352 [Tanacetum coccineum]|uniref:Integrase, catalytic region, zinc finger, CCHC-type, peptidase aspartic, catalytic n=1 Tax=Tanacetum coccineum TaxID=301880 RepID=A0ABQ5DQ38_9ASTR